MPVYLAINMNDFHANQKNAETTVRVVFVDAKNKFEAGWHMGEFYPETPWAIITKASVDKQIFCGEKLNKQK